MWCLVAAAVGWAAGASVAMEALPDRIVTTATTISGIKVTAANSASVTYTKFEGGAPSQIEFSKVVEISWGDTPPDIRRALQEYRGGNYAGALQQVLRSPEAGPREFWYAPFRLLLHGQCLLNLHKPGEALPKFDQVLRGYPQSFYAIEAIQGKGECHLAAKEFDKAGEAFALLDPKGLYDSLTAAEPYGKLWQLRGRLRLAEAYAQVPEKVAEAAKTYDRLAEVTESLVTSTPAELKGVVGELTSMYQRALLGSVEVLLGAGKLDEAQEKVEEVGGKITEKPVRLKLYMTLGNLLAKAAEKAADEKDKKVKYKEALLAYMRVYILYPEQKAERPRAMMGAATVSQLLGSKEDRERAGTLYKAIIAEFPESPEAKEAPRRLETLGMK